MIFGPGCACKTPVGHLYLIPLRLPARLRRRPHVLVLPDAAADEGGAAEPRGEDGRGQQVLGLGRGVRGGHEAAVLRVHGRAPSAAVGAARATKVA